MEVDDLYALPPEQFVAARNALVKELKAHGQKADAAIVAKLTRPTPVAWALNQVARTDTALVIAAIEASDALRRASPAAVAGDPEQLRAATAAERAAARAVMNATAPHLGARAGAAQTALLATLRVAGLDHTVASELRRGVLTTEHAQPGFGFGAGVDDSPIVLRPPKRPTLRAVPDLPPDVDEAAVAERAAAREAERERKRERVARQRTADRLTKEATRLAKEADEAEAAAVEARARADHAAARAQAAVGRRPCGHVRRWSIPTPAICVRQVPERDLGTTGLGRGAHTPYRWSSGTRARPGERRLRLRGSAPGPVAGVGAPTAPLCLGAPLPFRQRRSESRAVSWSSWARSVTVGTSWISS